MARWWSGLILQAAVVGVGYYALTRAGRLLELPPTGIAIFWPASGLGLAAFVLTNRRRWPAIAIAIAAANMIGNIGAGQRTSASLVFAAANVVEAAGGAWALQTAVGRRPRLDGLRDLACFVALAAVANTMAAAVIGAAGAIELAGAESGFVNVWRQWWVADANGILVVAPLILAIAGNNWRTPMRWRELGGVSLAGATGMSLLFGLDAQISPAVALYALLPLVLWAALRGGIMGFALTFAPSVAIAVAFTAHDRGPFAAQTSTPGDAALDVQLFLGSLGLAALFVAIVPSAHSRSQRERALYAQQRTISLTLQRSLLVQELPAVPNAELAVSYRPGVSEFVVGGDWYDAFELPRGRLALVVGDVVGRGLEASSTMGKLRSAIRALAPLDDGPARLVERLDEFARQDEASRLATVVYAEVDPTDGALVYACAGHPPPLLVAASGAATFLDDGRSMPLAAVDERPVRDEARITVASDDVLILYTDGLVERRGEAITVGLNRLRERVEQHDLARQPVETLVDAMLEDTTQPDDVCVLILSRP